ncbi:MAG: hypothetical protein K6B72_12775 [Lachnospiraceae bacterium]|nr:hypothetical protein [Lachnospiraceae bacterium]
MENGNLKTNGVHLRDHEYATVKLLLENGYDVELIPPSQISGLRMPDIMLQGTPWEMKAPEGNGKKTVQNTMQNAAHQSGNVIIDLRRSKMSEDQALRDFEREFQKSKHIKRMKIIKKDSDILDFRK